MYINLKKLDAETKCPHQARPKDAGADLRSCENLVIEPGCRACVKCGFAIEIPDGFCGLVIPRSGLAKNHGITVLNSPGLIDSGYRGEICVVLLNTDTSEAFSISKGDRIAQLVIIELPTITFRLVDELEDSDRGMNGFGSSGVK